MLGIQIRESTFKKSLNFRRSCRFLLLYYFFLSYSFDRKKCYEMMGPDRKPEDGIFVRSIHEVETAAVEKKGGTITDGYEMSRMGESTILPRTVAWCVITDIPYRAQARNRNCV